MGHPSEVFPSLPVYRAPIILKASPVTFNLVSNDFVSTDFYSISDSWAIQNFQKFDCFKNSKRQKLRIYIYSISYNLIKEVVSKLRINLIITKEIKKTSLIIGLKNPLEQNKKLLKLARKKKIPIYKVNRSTIYQITKLIQFIML